MFSSETRYAANIRRFQASYRLIRVVGSDAPGTCNITWRFLLDPTICLNALRTNWVIARKTR